jgi:glycine/D-amino acid oxidase-like deaminating enzyme
MKIAVIGAGFCGLSLGYFLLQSGRSAVTLFDPKGIGGGASGIATGLLHPYAGEQGHRSWRATEAIGATRDLLKQVERTIGRAVVSEGGILRVMQNDAQRQSFLSHIERYGDVEQINESSFLIRSGMTIHCQTYLQGLWKMVEQRGGVLIPQGITSLSELSAYDQVILAAGGGIIGFPESEQLRYRRTKGQVLTAEVPVHLHAKVRSMIGKGYLAAGEDPGICYLGSTYEKPVISEEPDRDFAERAILPKTASFFPDVDQLRIVDCRSGVRVSRLGHYYPIVARFSPSTWALTAMGSRGLLYHAYLARFLAEAILTSDSTQIPSEVLFKINKDF